MGKLLLIFHGDNIASFEKRSHFFIHLFLNCYSNSRKLLAVIYTYYIHIYILSIAEKKSLTLSLSLLNFLFLLFFFRSIFSTIILKVGFELLFLLIYVKNLPEELSSEVEFFTDDTSLFIIVN